MKRALFFGLATLDIQYYVDQFPSSNIKVKAGPPEFFVGGPATNAAVAFSVLNGKANLVTAIGESSFKPYFKKDFERYQVDCVDVLENQEHQPVLATVVTSGNGDRTVFSHHPKPTINQLDVKALFDQILPEVIMVDGFYPELAIPICQEAGRRNISVVFDGGSWKRHLPDLLPLVDFAICSNDFIPPGCKNADDVFQFLNRFNILNKAITRGSESLLFQQTNEVRSVKVPSIEVVDTLGAGDFFHGAFCSFILTEKDFQAALEKSVGFASKTCLFKGTRDWINKVP